ncbi:MAG: 30S ribosomal protein S5 [Alphaproteobacteria bacterium]
MANAERPARSERPAKGEGRGEGRGKRRDRDKREEGDREGGELVERLVAINRVAKVVKGGRRFGFAALVVVGDGRGRIGAGAGKAREVPEAIKKATDQAKRRMMRVPLREGRTLHHDIEARFGAGRVRLRTAVAGTGIIAGGPLRAVFEVLGIQDVVAKSLGSSNPYNMVKAALEAFKKMESPRMVAGRRGRRVNEVLGRKGDEKEKSDD